MPPTLVEAYQSDPAFRGSVAAFGCVSRPGSGNFSFSIAHHRPTRLQAAPISHAAGALASGHPACQHTFLSPPRPPLLKLVPPGRYHYCCANFGAAGYAALAAADPAVKVWQSEDHSNDWARTLVSDFVDMNQVRRSKKSEKV